MFVGHLSPEDNSAAEVYRLTPSLSGGGVVKFPDEQAPQPFPAVPLRGEMLGEPTLVPFIIFLMILSPVLIPAAVTVMNVMKGNHRPAATAGYPRSLASHRLVPAAA
jgi:hypothetical protein